MKIAAVAASALLLVALSGCKPSGGMTADAVQTTPVQADETPAPVMTDADAASLSATLQSPAAAETPAASATCTDEIGQSAAQKLADRCIAVSPATHPPCNAENTCKMIQDEIDRACAMYGAGEKKPAECAG
ncbi:MAG: hypothetical protein WDN06_18645 [Asticcacaulis sp.]